MLEYFTYKKVKKHKAQKEERERLEQGKNEAAAAAQAASSNTTPAAAANSPVIVSTPSDQPTNALGQRLLDNEDEQFLRSLTSSERDAAAAAAAAAAADASTSDEPHTRPPLPNRPRTIDLAWESDASSVADGKNKNAKDTKTATPPTDGKGNRLSFLAGIPRSISVRVKDRTGKGKGTANKTGGPKANTLAVPTGTEADREQAEVERVLNDLNLASSTDNKVFSLSKDSAEVVQRFTQVLKDLTNGVPTAYNDLVKLIEDRDKVISKNFDKLPKGLQKLVTQLPDQLSAKLGPEVLAMAAEAQGLAAHEAGDSMKGAAKQFINPKNLYDLVTKPGAVVGLLKGIVNALKVRWPAFIGTNVLWSVAVFLLLSVLWYCYKRGREERLAKEAGENPIDGSDRIEELPDDPQLPPSQSEADRAAGSPLVSLSPAPTEEPVGSSSIPRKPVGK